MEKWTRRGLITAGLLSGGALVVGVAIRPGHRAPRLAPQVADRNESLVNAWVKIAPDNTVTAIVPHSEMGQGVLNTMAQMLADEMDADWQTVRFQQAPATDDYANYPLAREYVAGNVVVPGFLEGTVDGVFLKLAQTMALQPTGGSTAVRLTGQRGMRIAGAAAREMIVKAAAKTWDVPAGELRTEASHVHHDASGRTEPYAAFAAEAAKHAPPSQPKLKTPDQFKLMGRSLSRMDIPAKVDGTAQFGIDVDLPGMKYAAVMGPPVLGSKVEGIDSAMAEAMPGVIRVMNMGDFVAVIGEGYWQAQKAADTLRVTWTKSDADTLDQKDFFARYRADMDDAVQKGNEAVEFKEGKARATADKAARIFEAEYTVPFLAHAAMEPLNGTAWARDGKCEIWSGMQDPLAGRAAIAKALDMSRDDIIVHNVMLGGGFGRRGRDDYGIMAARLAMELDFPVKMIWSREQDTTQDFYRPAAVSRFKAGLDEGGMPVSWENQFVQKLDPPDASLIPYKIDHQYIHYVDSPSHIRLGAWRSVDHTQHGFFIESFIDELAHEAGKDGYAFRRELLAHAPRHLAVLEAAAKAAGWGRVLPSGHGLGIALTESFGTVVAQVAEVDASGPLPRVLNVYCAADPGYVMNPDGFTAQMESGIIYGLTAALYGEITIKQGAVMQSNFDDYEMVRMGDAPDIAVVLINSGAKLGGGGEPGTPPIAPAVANAIFAATGKRIRDLPIGSLDGSFA